MHSPFLRSAAALAPDAAIAAPPSARGCTGAAGYIELHAAPLLAETGACVPLAASARVLDFDLTHAPPEGECRPPPTPLSPLDPAAGFSRTLRPDALLTWWECVLHPESPLLSTSPYRAPPHAERDHWANALFLLPPNAATPPLATLARDAQHADGESRPAVRVASDDHELWMDVAGATAGADATGGVARRACTCGLHTLWGAARLQQINQIDSSAAAVDGVSSIETQTLYVTPLPSPLLPHKSHNLPP